MIKNNNLFLDALKKGQQYLQNAYFYVTSTIRHKLIAIISLIVFSSIALLIYISLVIFEENMTNMIVFLHSKATSILATEVESTIESYIKDTIKCTKSGTQVDIETGEYKHFLYVARLSFETDGSVSVTKRMTNDKLLDSLKIDKDKFRKHIRNLYNSDQKVLSIQSLASSFNQIFWLLFIPREKYTYISVINPIRLYGSIADKSSGSAYISYLVNSDGNLILHQNKDVLSSAKDMLSNPVVNKMYQGKSTNGVLRFEDDGELYFGSFERLDKVGVGLISNIPEKLALEGVNAVRLGSVLIAVIIVSAAVLFIYFFAGTISGPLRLLSESAKKVTKGDYRHTLEVKTRDEVGELTKVFNVMTQGLEEREKLKGALGKFVNTEIAEQVLRGEIKLGGERKEATVLFMDIRGFTAISEKLKPEEVVEFLNEYMTLMVDIISRTGGVVDKFIGDAIMAIWGAPVPKGNDIENCLNATLMMRESIVFFNTQRKKKNKFPILFGCGINTGDVISGQIGSPDRHEYTVIGDTVNLASRVETLSKPFGVDILITENTYKLVKDIFSVLPMDKVKVKGKNKTQQIYTLLGRKDDPKIPKTLSELRKEIGREDVVISTISVDAGEKKYEII